MNKRIGFAALVIASFVLAACQPANSTASVPVQEQSGAEIVIVQGRVEPAQFLDLAFSANGLVAEVLASEGAVVEPGDLVARLSGAEARLAELARAQQELSAAEQALQDLEDAAAVNEAQAQVDLIAAQKAADSAEEKVDDLEAQFNPDEDEVEEAEANRNLTLARLQNAKELIGNMKNGVDQAAWDAALIRRETAVAAVSAAQAALDTLELRAPLAGTLVSMELQTGQFVTAGQLVASLADLTSWSIQTDDLTELEVVQVFKGERARLILDALPANEMSAQVTHIAERYEEKRGDVTYTVTLSIQDPVDALRWGMTGQIRFVETD